MRRWVTRTGTRWRITRRRWVPLTTLGRVTLTTLRRVRRVPLWSTVTSLLGTSETEPSGTGFEASLWWWTAGWWVTLLATLLVGWVTLGWWVGGVVGISRWWVA